MELRDKFDRVADYLRIGVTDRCNLRCRYCMPEKGIDFADRKDLLSYEEIIRLARVFRELGVNKVRLTGGEPFVRKDIGFLLKGLSDLFPKVHITTNATLLQNYIPLLKEVNISGLNISIDSLDRDKFFLITRRDTYDVVMSNILACIAQKVPAKLNVVVMKGVNDMEIVDFVQFGKDHGITVRFIEAMPFNEDDGNRDVFLPAVEILNRISERFPDIRKVENGAIASSDTYVLEDGQKVGIIPAYSRTLCSFCNRIRMTPQGELMTCLYSTSGTDLRSLVRTPDVSDADLKQHIANSIIKKKKDGFVEEKDQVGSAFRSMTKIGG
ncbi:MAG: GTP 3',8-cyclase MoaA [Saprospiraceae bacterium]|nr:GTP 3',8-cyclase MoaA [Saprospiraceae bacterium]